MPNSVSFSLLAAAACAVMAMSLAGCAPRNPHETGGFLRPVALQRACISGRVTDAISGRGIDEALVDSEPAVPGPQVVTNRDGFYYAEFPGGSFRLTFVKKGYRSAGETVQMTPGETVGRDVSLDPTAPVIVDAGKAVTNAAPGSTVTVKATTAVRDGSRLTGIAWKVRQEEGGVTARMTGEKSTTVQVTLPGADAYKRSLLYRLRRDGRLLNRWMVVGLSPSDMDAAGRVTLTVTATTTSGTYTDTVDIVADLYDFAAVNPGLQNAALGKPVFLQGKDQTAYSWSLAAPDGSAAVLRDAATRNPSFTPDVPGTYIVREGGKERLTIHTGLWSGAVVAKETEIRPRWIGLNGCLCHFSDPIAPKFTAWRDSGHAEIFTRGVNSIFRYEERCFTCHSVGFDEKARGGGISSAPSYTAFLKDATLWDHGKTPPIVRPRPGNLDFMIDAFPDVAKFTNVQCENCHGPNNSIAHATLKRTGAPERISLVADGCSICHDQSIEPSYRQWLNTDHANYNLAIEVATVDRRGETAGDCGRCHSGQGFLAWVARGNRTAPLAIPGTGTALAELAALGLTAERVHPVTCAICHDPHNPGSSFRSATEKVPLRTADYARLHPGEFRSDTGGRGAVCIACHSTSTGPHNDGALRRLSADLSPHACQSDVMFGENAFFIDVGASRSHARIEDSCVWCHVKPVPKPSWRGYPRGGANHTFKTEAGLCNRCHKEFAGDELMAATERDVANLKVAIETALAREIGRRGGITLVRAPGGADLSLSAAAIKNVLLVEAEGNMAVEMASAKGVYKMPFSRLTQGGSPLLSTDTGQVIAKAAWNYFLLKNDGSKGVHNPQFVAEVLGATLARLRELQK